MGKLKRSITISLGIVALLVIVLLAGVLLLPLVVDSNAVKQVIRQELSSRLAGTVNFENIAVSYFPRPHASVRQLDVTVPGKMSLHAASMRVYLRLFPLLRGSLEADLIRLQSPELEVTLPSLSRAGERPRHPITSENLSRLLESRIRLLPQYAIPNVDFKIEEGRLKLLASGNPVVDLKEINAFYKNRSGRRDFNVRCTSDLWKSVATSGWLKADTLEGAGQIVLTGLEPQSLIDRLFPATALKIEPSEANLIVDWVLKGSSQMQIRLDGTMPALLLKNATASMTFSGNRMKASILIERRKTSVSLDELSSDSPALALSGRLSVEPDWPQINLSLSGTGIDVAASRRAALLLAGDVQTVQEVFDVLRAGSVPQLTMTARGSTLEDLSVPENIHLRGRLEKGRLFIPEVLLDLKEVFGDAEISGGILSGTHLRARLGNSRGRDGTLQLGLKSESDAFHLDIAVQADLSELPPVLGRVIEEPSVLAELALIKEVRGSAAGRLILGDSLHSLHTRVKAGGIQLAMQYGRLPFPIRISRGEFESDATHFNVRKLEGTLGQSDFGGLSATVRIESDPHLSAAVERVAVSLEEIYPWLEADGRLGRIPETVRFVRGTLVLNDLKLSGPLLKPNRLESRSRGEIDRVELDVRRLSDVVRIKQGDFEWEDSKIRFKRLAADWGQSAVTELSADIDWNDPGAFVIRCPSAEVDIGQLRRLFLGIDFLKPVVEEWETPGGKIALTGFELRSPLSGGNQWHLETTAALDDLFLRTGRNPLPVHVQTARIGIVSRPGQDARENRLSLDSAQLAWGDTQLTATGQAILSSPETRFDMELRAGLLEWSRIQDFIDLLPTGNGEKPPSKTSGKIHLTAGQFRYEPFTWQPLEADIKLGDDTVEATIARAFLCGLSTTGTIRFADRKLELRLASMAGSQALEPSVVCLTENRSQITGTFTLESEIHAHTIPKELPRSIKGGLTFNSREGRIDRFGLLAKIFSLLNVTEIYRGQVPDLAGDGFPYTSMSIAADIRKGNLYLTECLVDAPSMGLACEGEMDLVDRDMDIVILVAPFRTVDRIVKFLPVIGTVLGGTLVSIPFRAEGDWRNPTVIPMSPTAVGSGVLGIMKRTLRLPITLIQPLFEKPEKEKPRQPSKEAD